MVQAIEETCHCLVITLFNVGTDNVELHLLEVLFHGHACSVKEQSGISYEPSYLAKLRLEALLLLRERVGLVPTKGWHTHQTRGMPWPSSSHCYSCACGRSCRP